VPAVWHWQVPAGGAATPVFLPVYRVLVGEPTDRRPAAEFLAPGIDLSPAGAVSFPAGQSLAALNWRVLQPPGPGSAGVPGASPTPSGDQPTKTSSR
jgi:hypothetical protein